MTRLSQILLLVASVSTCSCFDFPESQHVLRNDPEGTFNWSAITPFKSLKWHKCYERQECARLEVPMDRENSSLREPVALAVIRDPVNISRSDPEYGGSIFVNPGGPGGSGVDLVRWAAYEAHHKIEGPKRFDFIGWDPRGVGHTTPEPFCFDSELDRQLYWLKQDAVGMVDESDYALHYNLQAAKAFGQSCNSTIMRYVTTYATVQDIVAISDALEPDVKDPLINFWGISYGTLIGNTLATIYPHRLGKMILDAVLDTHNHLSGNWRRSLRDTGRILEKFCSGCHNVGPEKCPFYEATPPLISSKLENLIDSLPMPVANALEPGRTATVLTTAILRSTIFNHLYKPHFDFPALAQMLQDLSQSPPNTTLISSEIPSLRDPHTPPETVLIRPSNDSFVNPFPISSPKNAQDSERIIACTDADPIYNWTVSDFKSYLSDLKSDCPLVVGPWSQTMTACTGWPESKRAPAYLRFVGPFGSKLSDYSLNQGARPILFIGNEADPVCPLVQAQTESKKHEGSIVLQTNIYGHATVPVNPSRCVWEVQRRYWNFGELPEEGTVCKGDWDIDTWETT